MTNNIDLDIGNGILLGKADKFCYLGEIQDADGWYDSAVMENIL